MTKSSEILKKYIPIADAIADTFGSKCEVVLHDLTRPQSSVIYTKNGLVTGRDIGQSFNHLFYQVLRSEKFKNDYVANYKTMTADRRTIKSSTALIRDDEGVTIGAFCINIDIENLIQSNSFLEEFIKIDEENNNDEKREIVDNVWSVVTDLIMHAINEFPISVSEMNKTDKLKIVSFLEEKGLFLIKGAIDEIAKSLQVSKITIYGYLDEIKNKNK